MTRFGGAGEHVIVKGFKGVVDDKARSVAAWIKTTDSDGSVVSWGASTGNGRLWDLVLKEGKLALQVGGGELLAETQVNNINGGMLRYYRFLRISGRCSSLHRQECSISSSSANPSIETGDSRDLMIGTNAPKSL